MSDAKAEVDAANAAAIPQFRKTAAVTQPLADVRACNPSLYKIGTFMIRVTAFANGDVHFEAVDVFCKSGGIATVSADEMPVTYLKFIEYGDQSDDKVLRVCWVTDEAANRVKLVIGKGVSNDATKLRKIKWSIELKPIPDVGLATLAMQIRGDYKNRKTVIKVGTGLDSLSTGLGGLPMGLGGRSMSGGPGLAGLMRALAAAHGSSSRDSDDE